MFQLFRKEFIFRQMIRIDRRKIEQKHNGDKANNNIMKLTSRLKYDNVRKMSKHW